MWDAWSADSKVMVIRPLSKLPPTICRLAAGRINSLQRDDEINSQERRYVVVR